MAFRPNSLRFARVLAKELTTTPGRCCSSNVVSTQHGRSFAPVASHNFLTCSGDNTLKLRKLSTKADPNAEPSAPTDSDSPTAPEEITEAEPPIDDGSAAATSPEANKLAELENQIKDLKDNLLRSLAEQENTRRIAKRDVEQARSFAITSFAKSLLDTSDNLSRALDAVPEELRHDHANHPVLANLYEGISMTDEGLTKAFAKNGLMKFGQKGEKFDPNKHEALFEYPDPNGEAGCIGQVMKVGFMLNNRVVRPAEVGVIKAT